MQFSFYVVELNQPYLKDEYDKLPVCSSSTSVFLGLGYLLELGIYHKVGSRIYFWTLLTLLLLLMTYIWEDNAVMFRPLHLQVFKSVVTFLLYRKLLKTFVSQTILMQFRPV